MGTCEVTILCACMVGRHLRCMNKYNVHLGVGCAWWSIGNHGRMGSTICPTSEIVCFSGIYLYIFTRRKLRFFPLDIEFFGYPNLRTYQFVSPSWYYHLYRQVLVVCCKFNVMWHKVMLHPKFSDTQTSMNGSLFMGTVKFFCSVCAEVVVSAEIFGLLAPITTIQRESK